MAETRLCPECGLELRPDASPEELCPRCLLAAGTGGADDAEILESLVGRTVDGKYRVERPLGRGGMGAVFLATHLGTERPVALKVLAPHLVDDEESVERFRREARAAGRLRHPNIVNVTDFGFADLADEGVIAYLVMEYLDGISLAEYLERGYERPLPWVADVVEQIALAVDEAHGQGVIHRDLKPANIWLVPDGRGGHHVKVLDFGLAKLRAADSSAQAPVATAIEAGPQTLPMAARPPAPRARGFGAWRSAARITGLGRGAVTLAGDPPSEAAGLTRVGTVIGTPLYMSPEQCRGETLDSRSDVYSLGVVAYQLLTGLLPFKGDTATLIAQHIERAPSPVSLMCRRLPESVDEAVMPALAKTSAERPASAGVFAAGLTAALQTCGERAESILGQAVAIYGSRPWTFLAISPFTGLAPVAAFVSVLVLVLGAGVGGVRSVAGLLAIVVVALLGNGLNAALVVPAVARLLERPGGPALSAPSPRLLRRIPLVLLSPFLAWDESARFRLEVVWLGVIIAGLSAMREQGWHTAGFLFLVCAVVLLGLVRVRSQLASSVLLLEGRTIRESARRSRALAKRFAAVYDHGGGGGEMAMTFLFVGLVGSALAVASLAVTAGGASLDGQLAAVLIAVPVVAALVLNPILSIAFALRYLKARRLGGERLDDLAGPVDDCADPYTWMQSPLDADTLRVQPDWTLLAAVAGATLLAFSALGFVIAVSAFHPLALAPLVAGMWLATRALYQRTGLVVTDELVSQPSLFVGRRTFRWDDVHWSQVTGATMWIEGTGVGLVKLRLRDYRNGRELRDYIAHQLRRRQKAFLSSYWRW